MVPKIGIQTFQVVNVITSYSIHYTKLYEALLEAPGNWGERGVDIACGEGQPLGAPLASGGPYFGFLCCREELVRQMPGRIVGRTLDLEGNRITSYNVCYTKLLRTDSLSGATSGF